MDKEWSFPLSIFSVNMNKNPQETPDLVTFTEEILNGKLHVLCSGRFKILARVDFRITGTGTEKSSF